MKNITIRDSMGGIVFQVKDKNGIFTLIANEDFAKLKIEIRDDENNIVNLYEQKIETK